MPLVLLLHDRLGFALVLYLAALGVWGLANWRRGRGVSPGYRGAIVIATAVAVAQGAFGAVLALQQPPRDLVHILYGLSIVATFPLAYNYARDKRPAQQSLVFGIASLFAVGLAIRGITTG